MRHRRRGRKLGRNSSHRAAMWRNLICSILAQLGEDKKQPSIVTTAAKAKEVRPLLEKLVTNAKSVVACGDSNPAARVALLRGLFFSSEIARCRGKIGKSRCRSFGR